MTWDIGGLNNCRDYGPSLDFVVLSLDDLLLLFFSLGV